MTETAARRSRKLEFALFKLWHAWVAGAFLVAYLTADEDTYAMHLFAGYAVLAAIGVRLAAGALLPKGSPLRLPRPGWRGAKLWLWAALLAMVAVSALSGAVADGIVWLEDPHEAVSQAAMLLIFGHLAYLLGRRAVQVAAMIVVAVPLVAWAGEPARDALLADYARQAKVEVAGFSAQRGEALFRSKSGGGDARTPSCASCHTDDPRKAGSNAKTGRAIEPVAVSVNPKRFTDGAEVEKHFSRDCKSVFGRACTALEKGDYITFMVGQ